MKDFGGLFQDVTELDEFVVLGLEGGGVGCHFEEVDFEGPKVGIEVVESPKVGIEVVESDGSDTIGSGRGDRELIVEANFIVEEPHDAEHVVAPPDVFGEGSLKGGLVGVEVLKLAETKIAEFIDGVVGSLSAEVESEEDHFFGAKEGA